jgi:cell surface protein SprA
MHRPTKIFRSSFFLNLMMMKHLLLAVSATLSLVALYAFSYPDALGSRTWTLLFPVETPGIAQDHAMQGDTLDPIEDRYDDFLNTPSSPFDLRDPAAIESNVEYDPNTGLYLITERIGDDFFRAPTYMTFEEYTRWRDEKQRRDYFDRLQGASDGTRGRSALVDPISKFNIRTSLIERLFGGTDVDIKPQGNINLTFGLDYQNVQNPILTRRQQRQTNFDFDMDINMSAQGKIGEKLNLNFNYNTQATFDFDNQMKLHYDPKNFSEDEILQNIEAGNVSLPLRSSLIKGAQNLFGIKTELKFGHLRTTLVASQQRSKQNNLNLQGGAQVQQFVVPIDEYDENRHFFISHWNRDQFEPSLKCLPVPLSQFTITRMEVWITNDRLATENVRDIVAVTDLAEPNPFLDGSNPLEPTDPNFPNYQKNNPTQLDNSGRPLPDNENNQLYPRLRRDSLNVRKGDKVVRALTQDYGMRQIRDFDKVRARMLNSSEYTFHDQLGFVSINLNVQPDQVVGVAVEYTYNGLPHKIGEFSSDVVVGDSLNQNVLFVKMLKGATANVRYPIWDLMMKNVYAVGAANVDPQEFRFDIFYEDPGKGQKRFLNDPTLPAGLRSKPLIQVFNLDNLNLQGDPGADGIFDFVPGLTINLRSGRVMLPVLEPFGKFLYDKIKAEDPGADSFALARTLLYTQLYDSTLFRAREFQQLNRFTLRGSYKSSQSSEISLGTFNLPPGSVRVSAGGRQLIEGQDYDIDYNIGKVRIINDAILQSGQNINVSFEDNTLFGFNARTMLGARFDYEFSKKLTVGGTFMNLFERPLTQKVNFGDDPINNKVYGLDFNYSGAAPWITRMVDWLPFISTKAESSITAQAEVALLQPGYNRAINQGDDQGGTVYIDDFEGSTANIPLSFPANSWVLSSVPQGDQIFAATNLYNPEGPDSLALGANRAKLSWYVADPSARDNVDGTNPYTRLFQFQDIFPNRQLSPLEQSVLRPLDITLYPRKRGPYNFEVPNGYPGISAGLNNEGQLLQPDTRWGGFMRGINNNDFEAANIEFIEFWMLNPYMDKPEGISEAGRMHIDIGNISEDIMRDSRQYFENGLPTSGANLVTVRTPWGRVPVLPPIVPAFDNLPENRRLQDVGFDGLNNEGEREHFSEWLDVINASSLGANAKAIIGQDPSADDFIHYRDGRFSSGGTEPVPGLLRRYENFNSGEGNTPEAGGNGTGDFVTSATNFPDAEDLNRDNSLNETEAYFRYTIPLERTSSTNGFELDQMSNASLAELITDSVNVNGAVWYRFKVPLDWTKRQSVNGIQDFRSIRFVRVFWEGFTEQTTFRLATFELGRNQWRRFTQLVSDADCSDRTKPTSGVAFDVNAVSIEENAARTPFNYTIPPGISRENSVGAFPDILQNEQALSMNVCGLPRCEGRAIFKTLNMDLRQYERLKMFVHAEPTAPQITLDPDSTSVFIRLGSDFFSNYYEYEIPLKPSDLDAIQGYIAENPQYKAAVWNNVFDFPLEALTNLKKERNAAGALVGALFSMPDPENPQNTIRIIGNPNLGYVKGAMIGVFNRNKLEPQCFEVWVNEMRLTGFNNRGGYAGTSRVDIKLADLGNVSAAGTFTSRGWGGIDQKLLQRQLEDVYQFDVSTTLQLDRFFPEKWGLRLPFYAQYSNLTRRPEYDPYDLDIKLSDKIRNAAADQRDSLRATALDVTEVRGWNFTNVRKERRGAARKVPLPWNIENFSISYAKNRQERRTPFIIRDRLDQQKASLDYTYATGMKPITPFKKLIKKDKYLKFLSDFNFNPLPETYGFNTTLERLSNETVWRFAGEDPKLNTYYNRRFTWDRNYDLGWTISKGLKFNFDATARSLIDEPLQYNLDGSTVTTSERRDSIWTNMRSLGRPKSYNQTASLNYTVPFKQIPFLEWINLKASYTAGYTWTAQSLKLQNMDIDPSLRQENFQNNVNLGNVIQNNSVRQVNGDFNFESLYNRSKYLAKINKPSKPGSKKSGTGSGGGRGGDDKKGGSGGGRDGDGPSAPGGRPGSGGGTDPGGMSGGGGTDKNSRRDKTDPANPAAPQVPGRPGAPGMPGRPGGAVGPDGKPLLGPDGKPLPAAADGKGDGKDDKGGKGDKKEKKKKDREPSMAERVALRPLMLLRKGRFTYSENYSTVVPGFVPETKLMGLSEGFSAPGWGFVAGFQPDRQWLDDAAEKGWMTHRTELNQQVMRNYTQNFDAGLTVEPFQDFRIEINANRQYTRNSTELFKDQVFNLSADSVRFEHRATRDMGSYTTSYFALQTMFGADIDGLFERFKANRPVISQRLSRSEFNTFIPHDDQENNPGFAKGYGAIHQEVLLPSFIAAYTEQDPNRVGLDVFRTMPALNWKLNYNGLSKVGKLNKYLASVQISHGYKGTLTVNSYNTDIFYDATRDPRNEAYVDTRPSQLDSLNFNYVARFEIPQVVISENFTPLFGLDMKFKNDMQIKADFKKSRVLAMSFIDYNLNETQTTGYVLGFGYRIKNVDIPFLTGSKKGKKGSSKKSKKAKNKPATPGTPPTPAGGGAQAHDLNIKFDFEYRDDLTIIHSLQRGEAQPSRGSETLSINPSIDYQLNKRLSLRLFTDYRRTIPKTSQSFPITTVSGGVTVQFKLN